MQTKKKGEATGDRQARKEDHLSDHEPQPILDPSCDFERQDRGEGMAVDDEKTYHRTEK